MARYTGYATAILATAGVVLSNPTLSQNSPGYAADAEEAAAQAVVQAIPELEGADLSMKLGVPRPLIVGVPEDGQSLMIVVGENRLKAGRDLRPGTYRVLVAADGAVRVTRDGEVFGFTATPPSERFFYAIGNFDVEWMCEKAPDLIKDYCTTFVWCATANLFC